MSRETPDEPAGSGQRWRRLLREPDALPGLGLADKDAAWDKLFERLNTKPRRRFFGYRVVAACILVSLIPAMRLFHDGTGADRTGYERAQSNSAAGRKGVPVAEKVRPVAEKVRPEAEKVRPAAPALRPQETLAERRPVSVARVKPGADPVGHSSRAPKRRLLPERDLVAGGTSLSRVTPAASGAREPDASGTGEPAGTAKAAPAAAANPGIPAPPAIILAENTPPLPAHPTTAAPKKQLKVVDINELEPCNTRPVMVAGRQPRPLRLGFGLGYSGVAENSPARGDESRLKINLTTQNH